MKRFFLILGLISCIGKAVASDRPKPKTKTEYNPALVSICCVKQKPFQVRRSTERVIPKIAELIIVDKGIVTLNTQLERNTVKNLLFAYADKDVLAMHDILKNLSPTDINDLNNNVCQPLGISLCNLPSFYGKDEKARNVLNGQDMNNFVSFFVGEDAGITSWKNRSGFCYLPKTRISSIVPQDQMEKNIVNVRLDKKITKDQAHTLLILVTAYINAFADKNLVTRAQNLHSICDQVPVLLINTFKNNIVRLLKISSEDIIGFENNIIHTGAKSIWNMAHNVLAVGGGLGLIALLIAGFNKLRS